MSGELKPCPFCGGEAIYGKSEASGRMRAVCVDCLASTDWLAGTDEADAAWNRRAERTCRVECYPPGYEDNLHYEVCSECGAILTAMRPGDRHSKRANYCPSCGARVVGEETGDAD